MLKKIHKTASNQKLKNHSIHPTKFTVNTYQIIIRVKKEQNHSIFPACLYTFTSFQQMEQ